MLLDDSVSEINLVYTLTERNSYVNDPHIYIEVPEVVMFINNQGLSWLAYFSLKLACPSHSRVSQVSVSTGSISIHLFGHPVIRHTGYMITEEISCCKDFQGKLSKLFKSFWALSRVNVSYVSGTPSVFATL
jgi:hypothetical protein